MRRYLEAFRRWWWLFLLGLLGGGALAWAVLLITDNRADDPLYEAQATILVQSQNAENISPTLSDIEVSQRLASTYRELVKTRPTLQKVATEPDIPYSAEYLADVVKVSIVPNTGLLQFVVSDGDPELAALIANTLAGHFVQRIQEDWLAQLEQLRAAAEARGFISSQEILNAQVLALENLNDLLASLTQSPAGSEELLETQVNTLASLTLALRTLSSLASTEELLDIQARTTGILSIVEPAIAPDSPVESSIGSSSFTKIIVGMILGGVVAALVVVLWERFNERIRTPEQVEKTFAVPTIGAMPQWRDKHLGIDGLLVAQYPHSRHAEIFRQVRTNFQFSAAAHAGKAFMLASPDVGDGNTTLLANLGIALAQDGARVVLVDGDLRSSTLHHRFKVPNGSGLSSLLMGGDGTIDTALQSSSVDGLHLLTSGAAPPNPAELLGSPKMGSIINALKERFDLVLLDSAPLIAFTDPVVLARNVDGVVMVAVANKTRVSEFQESLRKIQQSSTPVMGVLLNKTRSQGNTKTYRHYSGSDGQEA